MRDTSISWTDATWNVSDGCSEASPGCRNCYAKAMAYRFSGEGKPYAGLVRSKLRVLNADEKDRGNYVDILWTGDVRFRPDRLTEPLRWRSPRTVFVNSMSDLFHDELTNEQIAAVFGIMAATPQHTYQVLTKRAKRMREWFAWAAMLAHDTAPQPSNPHNPWWVVQLCLQAAGKAVGKPVIGGGAGTWPLTNVWLGVSVESQQYANERIPELVRCPARIRFLSIEPMLEKVLLDNGSSSWLTCNDPRDEDSDPDIGGECCESYATQGDHYHGIDWVIVGCESGPRARPCDVAWIRSLRQQCREAGVAFFLKQAREVHGGMVVDGIKCLGHAVECSDGSKRKGRGVIELPYLDGYQHKEMPNAT